jgi:uncharacterized protein (TIGR03067 family)
MYPKALLILVTGLSIAADAKEDVAKETKKLEGTWKVTASEVGGMKLPEEKLKDSVLIIKDGKFVMAERGKEKEGKQLTFKIDPSTKPKHLDLTDPKEKDAKPVPCIYALDGDELKVCIPLVEKGKKDEAKRPEGFETKDKPLMALTCKREKQ